VISTAVSVASPSALERPKLSIEASEIPKATIVPASFRDPLTNLSVDAAGLFL